jgi:hypothetical protein
MRTLIVLVALAADLPAHAQTPPVEVHVSGGAHGSSLGMQNRAVAEWPGLLANWLRASGLLK